MKKRHKLYIGVIMAACSLNAYTTPTRQAGNIDDFDGELGDYVIKRDGQLIPEVRVYMPIYPDDLIYVSKNHFIEIKQCGNTHRITHKDSPFSVKWECKEIGFIDNAWLSLKDFIQYLVTIVQEPPVHSYVKSDKQPPAMPMLEGTFSNIPTLKAGKRALSILWFNGKSPYQVQITTAEKTVLWQTQTKAQSVKTKKIHFKADHLYWLIIKAANHTTERSVKVVAKLPDYPEPLQNNLLPEKARRTLQASWLVKQDRIKWTFEAYQQVFDIADNYGPARELRKALGH
jgi:hypothetical protein